MAITHSKYSLLAAVCMIIMGTFCTSCNPEAISYTENVEISMTIEKISAGYVEVKASTNKEAFYLLSIQPVRPNINPQDIAKPFMMLALDSAYLNYLNWRNDKLKVMTPYIADFASHSLQYGSVNHYFNFLTPDTDYWIFAFVVDAKTNKPAGKLYLETIHTKPQSEMYIDFQYRVRGRWDYIYPMDSTGNIISDIPWVGQTVDSLELRKLMPGNGPDDVPGVYFIKQFTELTAENNHSRVLYGIHAQNNGAETGSTIKGFEIGHTYYTGMAVLDGPISRHPDERLFDIYRFTWMGDSTELYFTQINSTNGSW